ncbi:MAG: hypothetical protein AB1333_01380 [Patescibacteria group bacterium]
MDDKAKQKFIEVKELFNRMSHEIFAVVESYHIWRTLTFSRSIPEVGKEQAEKNAALLSLYKYFFIPTEQSHLQTFIVGLMKFFDKDSQALSIVGLIKKIEKNKSLFTADIIRSVYPNLDKIGAIKDDYVPIKQETINQIEQLRKSHEVLITNLKNIRDKQLAHTDMKAINGTFVPNEIEALIKTIQQTFNKLSNDFDLSSTIWDHLEDESIRSTQFVFENLERGEIQRKEEVRKKYDV